MIAGIGGVTVWFILCFAAKVFFARNKSSVSKSSNVQELEPIDSPKGGSAIVVADGGLLQIGTQL